MAVKGVANAGFRYDDETTTSQSSAGHETQQRICSRQVVEAHPLQPSCSRGDLGSGLEATNGACKDAGSVSLTTNGACKDAGNGSLTTNGAWKDAGNGSLTTNGAWKDAGNGSLTTNGAWKDAGNGSLTTNGAWKDAGNGSLTTNGAWKDAGNGPLTLNGAWKDAGNGPLTLNGAWKDTETQTEGNPTTLSSWKILRTKSSSEEHNSTPSSELDYVVVETRSLGFDASAQTRDAQMFRYSDAQVCDMVLAWQVLTIFMPSTWHMILYVADQVTSVTVAVDLCSQGERWWCGLTLTFLIVPSLIINIYAYEQLTRPDIASVAPLNKWLARLLLLAQLTPHYLIGRKVSWCYRAWRAQSWQQKRRSRQQQQQQLQVQPRRSPKVLWEQARADTDSATAKWFHSLLESVPQLSVQAYILMVKLRSDPLSPDSASVVTAALVASVVVSLTSASAGLASVMSESAWERVAAALAIFLTLGSRVLVCSGVGAIHPALWFAPLASATLLGFVTKVSESKEETYLAMLPKAHKYLFEAFLMAAVCPPFNAVGLFSSAPYVLAGLCFLALDPAAFLNIGVFVFSIVGQVIWLAVGFFVT